MLNYLKHLSAKKLVIQILLLTIVASYTKAQTYYVDNVQGNDANSGLSRTSAWKSLTKVSNTTFAQGAKILFKAGGTWTGQLFPKGSGSASNPCVIDTFGKGAKPLITGAGTTNYVLRIHNQNYWEINNLEITNPASSEGDRMGIRVSADDGLTHRHIHLKNLDVHDIMGRYTFDMSGKNTGGIGIRITGGGDNTRFDDFLIEGCKIYNIVRVGISSYSNQPGANNRRGDQPITGMIIRNNIIHHTAGDGLILRHTANALVERNLAYENHNGNESQVAHGVALWCRSTDNTVFQYNEVYNTRGVLDGHAFDADFEAHGTIFQYNYSHDNEGGFLLMMNGTTGTIVRYNISENDGRKAGHVVYFSDYDPGGNSTRGSATIYNNTFYIPSNAIFSDRATASSKYLNNIIFRETQSGTPIQSTSIGQVASWTNNCIFNSSSLPADPQLITANPVLAAPGTGGMGLNSVNGYKLQSGSPALNSGTLIQNNGGKDYFGNSVSSSSVPHRGFFNGSVTGPPPVAGFSISETSVCQNSTVTFTNASSGTISTYSWNFGSGATPTTASGPGPHAVSYSSTGNKTITLTVSGMNGNDSEVKTITVNSCEGNIQILLPVQDTYARDGNYGNTTFGITNPEYLETKNSGSPNNGYNREGFLTFDLNSIGEITGKAELKLFNSMGAQAVTVGVHSVAVTSWNETAITWNNKPATTNLLETVVVNEAGYYTWDVTDYVKAEKTAGRSKISFCLRNTTVTAPQLIWNSKESGSNKPELVIESSEINNPNPTGCSGVAANGDYSYEASSAGNSTTITFIPGAAIQGTTMSIITYKINNGGYTGEYMTADGMGNYTKSISAPAGATITFYFTYRVGTSTTERNSSANPHTYVAGSSCSAKLSALQEEDTISEVLFYPNPASDYIFIGMNEEATSEIVLSIYNMQGVEVVKRQIEKSQGTMLEKVDLTFLPQGIYSVHCQVEGKLKVFQLLKQ